MKLNTYYEILIWSEKEKNHKTYCICIPFNVSYISIVSCLIFHSLVVSGVWCVFVLLCLCFKVSWVILSVISLSEVQLSGVWCVWGLMCLRFDVSGFCLSGVWCVWGLTCLGSWLAPNFSLIQMFAFIFQWYAPFSLFLLRFSRTFSVLLKLMAVRFLSYRV